MSGDLPEGTRTVELALADCHGVLRGKRIPASQWENVKTSGIHMASVLYTWTPRCEIREDDVFLPPESGWPDMHVTPLIDDVRRVPWRPESAMVLCDSHMEDGSEIEVSPRAVLRRVLNRAAALGFEVRTGFEIEFYLLDAETKKPHFDDVQCYGISRGAQFEYVLAPIRNQLEEFGIPIEASNAEFAPGQFEVNVKYDEAMRTADNAVLFRNGVREIAAQHGCIASFMAKPSFDQSGSGVHIHHSLWQEGKNVFSDGGKLSDIGRWYLGGLHKHIAELTIFGSPTPNSFKRRQPYSFCPQAATWGMDNRTTALRVIEGSASAVRIEQRDGSADCNPYTILAAQIGAGLAGIEQNIEPGPMTIGDAYSDPNAVMLPANIPEAIELLEKSELARQVFGDMFVQMAAGAARYEHRFVSELVSDIERDRYLEAF